MNRNDRSLSTQFTSSVFFIVMLLYTRSRIESIWFFHALTNASTMPPFNQSAEWWTAFNSNSKLVQINRHRQMVWHGKKKNPSQFNFWLFSISHLDVPSPWCLFSVSTLNHTAHDSHICHDICCYHHLPAATAGNLLNLPEINTSESLTFTQSIWRWVWFWWIKKKKRKEMLAQRWWMTN